MPVFFIVVGETVFSGVCLEPCETFPIFAAGLAEVDSDGILVGRVARSGDSIVFVIGRWASLGNLLASRTLGIELLFLALGKLTLVHLPLDRAEGATRFEVDAVGFGGGDHRIECARYAGADNGSAHQVGASGLFKDGLIAFGRSGGEIWDRTEAVTSRDTAGVGVEDTEVDGAWVARDVLGRGMWVANRVGGLPAGSGRARGLVWLPGVIELGVVVPGVVEPEPEELPGVVEPGVVVPLGCLLVPEEEPLS